MTSPQSPNLDSIPEWHVAMERYTSAYDPDQAEKMIAELEAAILKLMGERDIQAYQNGESSAHADWQCVLDEHLDIEAKYPMEALGKIKASYISRASVEAVIPKDLEPDNYDDGYAAGWNDALSHLRAKLKIDSKSGGKDG